jgi:hypothetical protein
LTTEFDERCAEAAQQDPGRYNSSMPTRVLCLLLAVVLLWSGLSTFEPLRLVAPSSAEQQAAFAPGGGPAALDDGSVEDHHLDDLPSQAQGDPTTETPGLLLARLEARIPAPAMRRGPAFKLSDIHTPFLAGPLRPPCGAGLTA